jgi:hypothetical protein
MSGASISSAGRVPGSVALWLMTLGLAATSHADAIASSDARGCYESVDLERPAESLPTREIVVAVDQTTQLSERLVEKLLTVIDDAAVPGSRISMLTFSAYSARHYLHHELTLEMEQRPATASVQKIPLIKMRSLEHCWQLQAIRNKKRLNKTLVAATAGASSRIARSEIVNSVRTLALRLAGFPGQKILVLVSDGIEHATEATGSFYEDGNLRRIDPQKEVQALQSSGQLARLSGVHVYFFGGAISPNATTYRDQEAVAALAEFWRLYVAASGGTLQEFGTPELQSPLIR